MLALDGRTSYAALAKQAGWTEGRVIRRVEALHEAGILYFDVDLATTPLGFKATAYLWLIVEPARLATVGEEISRHAEVPFAAAITGSANLVASVVCRDSEALYEYVTTKISAVAGVRQLEISPILSRIKQAGSLMDGLRLATPEIGARGGTSLHDHGQYAARCDRHRPGSWRVTAADGWWWPWGRTSGVVTGTALVGWSAGADRAERGAWRRGTGAGWGGSELAVAGLPDGADERDTGSLGEVGVRGAVQQHQVRAGAPTQMADVGAAQRAGPARGGRPHRLLRGQPHLPDREGHAQRHAGGEAGPRVAVRGQRDGHPGGQ